MNHQFDTPPNGDFARYVERLSAQAALPGGAPKAGEHGLDVGMTPSSAPGGEAAAAAQRRVSAASDAGAARATSPGALAAKALLAVGGVALLVLWMAGVPIGVLLMLVAGGLWLAHQARRGKLPGGGVAKWQKVLEEAARKQREQQQRQSR